MPAPDITLIQIGERWKASIRVPYGDSHVYHNGDDVSPQGALGLALMSQYPELERHWQDERLILKANDLDDVAEAVDTARHDLNEYSDSEAADSELRYIQRRLRELTGG